MATMMQPPQTELNFTEMPEVYTHGTAAMRSWLGGGQRAESPDRTWFGEGRKKGQSHNFPLGSGVQCRMRTCLRDSTLYPEGILLRNHSLPARLG